MAPGRPPKPFAAQHIGRKLFDRSEDNRKAVIGALAAGGNSTSKAAEAVGVSVSTVQRTRTRYMTTGDVKEAAKSGRPSDVRTADFVQLVRTKLLDEQLSIRDAVNALKAAGHQATRTTVQRAAHDAGLRAVKESTKPLLTDKHKEQRLAFAQKWVGITAAELNRWVFVDESYVDLNGKRRHRWIEADDEIPHISTSK